MSKDPYERVYFGEGGPVGKTYQKVRQTSDVVPYTNGAYTRSDAVMRRPEGDLVPLFRWMMYCPAFPKESVMKHIAAQSEPDEDDPPMFTQYYMIGGYYDNTVRVYATENPEVPSSDIWGDRGYSYARMGAVEIAGVRMPCLVWTKDRKHYE